MLAKERLASVRMYLAAFSALSSAAAAGCVISWSGCAFTSMTKPNSVPRLTVEDSEIKSWIGSSIALAALFGSVLCSFIVKLLGARKTLICVGLPVIVGWALIGLAHSFTMIIVGRSLLGLCLGIITTSAPAYVSDIVTPSTRGFLGTCFQLVLCVGQLFVIGFGCLIEWNYLSFVGVVPAICCSLGMFFFGLESPFEMVEDGKEDRALEILGLLRKTGSDIQDEVMELKLRVEQNQQISKANSSTFEILNRKDVHKPIMITVMLMFFQQFSGINAVMFYLTDIFSQAVKDIDPGVCALLVSVALVVATFASGLMMDRFGRKFLLLLSGGGHVVTLFLMGLFYWKISPNATWIPVVCLVFFVVFFSFGYGPIPWMIAGEITPMEAKPMVSSIGSTTNWLCAFLTTKFFESLINFVNPEGAYGLFCVCSAFSMAYVFYIVPETKGTTIRDIQKIFLSK